MDLLEQLELVKSKLGPNEQIVIKVAPSKVERLSGKTEVKIKLFTLGKNFDAGMKKKDGTSTGKSQLGKNGVMLYDDFVAKNYAPYGLDEFFKKQGKVQLAESAINENTQLQEQLSVKDQELEALKARLVKLEEKKEPKAKEVKEEKK